MMMDIPTRKSLGQHWLNDAASLEAIAEAADLQASETVLEIGPGPGSLTKLLCQQARQVIAVELDERLANDLVNRVRVENLSVVKQDILQFDFSSLPLHYKVVANIPYYLTSNLIRVMSETNNPPTRAVLLIQKEVAMRAAAGPGDMSLLSVTAQLYWRVSLGALIPAELFSPPPKIDSQVLILQRRESVMFDVDVKQFIRIAKAGFSQRRKTLLNSLSAGLNFSRDETQAICDQASIDASRRAQSLSMAEWDNLYTAIHNH